MVSERSIQLRLFWKYSSQFVFAAPNYTPEHWWECDMWGLLRSGYAIEYEIKLSMSDFYADRTKQKTMYSRQTGEMYTANKHAMLSRKDERCPNRFAYVVPESLQDQVQAALPEWAGLLIISDGRSANVKKVVPPPLLHKNKDHDEVLKHCMKCITHRYWPMLAKIHREKQHTTRDGGEGEDTNE